VPSQAAVLVKQAADSVRIISRFSSEKCVDKSDITPAPVHSLFLVDMASANGRNLLKRSSPFLTQQRTCWDSSVASELRVRGFACQRFRHGKTYNPGPGHERFLTSRRTPVQTAVATKIRRPICDVAHLSVPDTLHHCFDDLARM
jgi:hypothetical protein